MRTHLDCFPCLVRQALDSVRLFTEDVTTHERIVNGVLRELTAMDARLSPPEMGRRIHRMIREALGEEDPYREIKERSNALALEWCERLRSRVSQSADPLETALRLAIAGNIIDYGPTSRVDPDAVARTIEHALEAPLDPDAVEDLRRCIGDAERILYLGDNAGEICFDRLLVERLRLEKVIFVVRGSPTINDATLADARVAGLTDLVRVIDNGTDIPGTVLEECSPAFREVFDRADLILAKGQGNYETLDIECGRVFFLLMAKCSLVAGQLGCPVGSIQLRRGGAAAAS